MQARRTKLQNERIGIECEDAQMTSIDRRAIKFNTGLESTHSIQTAKNTITTTNHTLDRNNSSSSFQPNNIQEVYLNKNLDSKKRSINNSNKSLIKRRESRFQSLGRSCQKVKYNIIGANYNVSNPSRILPQLTSNSESINVNSKQASAWNHKNSVQKW